ncbi:MAG: type II toxin-antitoxin system VapC family toxin [Actinomycetota bacterium]
MSFIYLDTSGLVKLLVAEEGSDSMRVWWNESEATTCRTTYPEARAALAAALRDGRLSSVGLRDAKADLEVRWDQMDIVEVTDTLTRQAGVLAEKHSLRAYDSVHLGAALSLEDEDLVVVTWDKRLGRAAQDAGLAVAPPVVAYAD